jgi:hypothetical protein
MNKREKALMMVIGAIVAIFVLGFGAKSFFLKPLQKLDRDKIQLQGEINKIRKEAKASIVAQEKIEGYSSRSFADSTDIASANIGEMLTRTILECGLSEADFSRSPIQARKRKGGMEIGWNVRGQGEHEKVINLLFTLEQNPYLHRIENVTISEDEKQPGIVRIQLRFMSFIMTLAPEVERATLEPELTLASDERRLYDVILKRDILRPYIKRVPPPKPNRRVNKPKKNKGPGLETFRIVSLSQWQGKVEVHIYDLTRNETIAYKPGDTIADGQIIAVDYRTLPSRSRPLINSYSRLIMKSGDDYWAVEKGSTLAERYRLEPDQLPDLLKPGS